MSIDQVRAHYDDLLAAHYSWMAGGFDANRQAMADQLAARNLRGAAGDVALDLGCGTGFHAVALADAGYRVIAVDASRVCLAELAGHIGDRAIDTVCGDLLAVDRYAPDDVAVALCMGDTLTHLATMGEVADLCDALAQRVRAGGWLALGFRDLTGELKGLDRFIPVRADDHRIFTCFLERAGDGVLVHDLVHVREGGSWTLHKSCYRKTILPPAEVEAVVTKAGFTIASSTRERGRVEVWARR